MGREGRTSSSLSANGGSMLGALILANGPSQPLEAATKYYVDSTFASLNANNVLDGVLPISSLPGFTGDATSPQGSNVITLTNLGVTPGSYAKIIVDAKGRVTGNDILTESDIPNIGWDKVQNKPNTLEGYGITDALSVTGGVFGGQMSVVPPTNPLSSVSKQYVDSALSGNSAVVGDIIRKPYASTPTGFLRCNGGVVDKVMYSDLYSVIGDTFSVNTLAGSGQPWQQQYQINDLQSGNLTNWVQNTNTPYAVLYHKCVVTKHRIYLIGGGNSSTRWGTIYTAPIQSDGVIGVWSAAASLPGEFAYFQAFVTKNRLYLIGGGGNTITSFDTIYTAPIGSDGALGTWTTSGNFPVAVNGVQVVVLKDRVYAFGGGNSSGALNSIYKANINTDGTLGAWSLYGNLPTNLIAGNVAVTKNRIYLIGGGTTASAFVNTVYSTTINSDGTLGTWSLYGTIPLNLTVGCIYVTKNCIYLLGGAYALNTYTSNIYKANINLDGTLSGWEMIGNMPYTLGYSTCVAVKNKLHVIAGYIGGSVSNAIMTATINNVIQDYSPYYGVDNDLNYLLAGSGKPWQQQYQINNTQTNDITNWSISTSLPVALTDTFTVVTKNRVYLLGGTKNGNIHSGIYSATINSDGTLGTWAPDGNIPEANFYGQSIVTKNRVYLLGGAYNAIVNTAPINADGTLGTWVASASLPGAVGVAQAFVTKNRVYLYGGNNGGGILSSGYTAVINSDGTLGAWSSAPSLPIGLSHSSVILTKNRVYLCGGYNGSYTNAVYSAIVYSNGTIGSWGIDTSLPGVKAMAQSFVTSDRVYLFGGFNGSAYTNVVYTAPINADGTLGTWTTGTSIPGIMAEATIVATKDHIYMIGGYNGGYMDAVYMATISGGLNDYSSYYDGSISALEPIDQTPFFALPDFSAREKNGINLYIKY
jgi:hypothetical protein